MVKNETYPAAEGPRSIDRRQFLKAGATAAVVSATGIPIQGWAQDELKWGKAPCRFCGTGCAVPVGVRNGRIEAVRGDEKTRGS